MTLKNTNFLKLMFIGLIISSLPGCMKQQIVTRNGEKKSPVENVQSNFTATAHLNFFVNNNTLYAVIDTLQYFTGDEANKAYIEDKKSGMNVEQPEGFYIRNIKVDNIQVKVAKECSIIMQTLSHDADGNYKFNEKISYDKLLNIVSTDKNSTFNQKLFRIDIINSELIALKEIYIP